MKMLLIVWVCFLVLVWVAISENVTKTNEGGDFINKLKTVLTVAICVALAAQINVQLFVPGFMISLAPIILPIMLYFNREYNPVLIAFTAGIISPLFRGFILFLTSNADNIIEVIYADILFYFAYGILFLFLYWNKSKSTLSNFFTATVISDYFSNLLEVSVMLHFKDFKYEMFQTLIIVAFIRATIVVCVILLFRYYNFLLRREEHEERYRKLIMITSNVKSEIYFMNKNNLQIEDVMKKAYYLYKALSAEEYPENLRETSLDVAKDVHEIKKDYISIIKGLEDQFNDKNDNVQMNVRDLISIVNDDVKEYIRSNKLKIHVDFKIHDNFSVVNHYYLVTILKNLIYNCIEAIDNQKTGYINIDIQKQYNDCIFIISDNGTGIKEEDINYIFNAGFSTKFKEETGDICRGIGLAHVKGIVDEVFGGTITVESQVGIGTKFTVTINEEKMESDFQ